MAKFKGHVAVVVGVVLASVAAAGQARAGAHAAVTPPPGMPIQHVIIIYQENHTFDNMLGAMCVQQSNRCNGAVSGLAGTTTIPLGAAADIVPPVDHSVTGQITATDGGKMDGFYKISGCTPATKYACYSTATPAEIPNLLSLATAYALSDNTFAQTPVMSWEQHLQLGSLSLDGFYGNNPVKNPSLTGGSGWGCISPDYAKWGPTKQWVPPCIPDQSGNGPRLVSPVPWVPNFYVDDMAANGISYNMYGALWDTGTSENIWCPSCMFASWELTNQRALTGKRPKDILTDISAGALPQVSFVTPTGQNSQHNTDSLTAGDNWIGSVVSAVQKSQYWSSTAIIIGYDDCGCFYDHVAPPAGMGMRTPLVIVSPYAKPGFVDTTQASFAPSELAFMEWVFGLPPLSATSADNTAYGWKDAFDFTQTPLPAVPMKTSVVPLASQRYVAEHPLSQQADPDS